MVHAQKPDFVFRRNGRVHLNRRGRQFSRLLAAEVCASALVMLDTPCSEVVWRVLATYSIRQFPLHFPSHASPCAITFQLDSTYRSLLTILRIFPNFSSLRSVDEQLELSVFEVSPSWNKEHRSEVFVVPVGSSSKAVLMQCFRVWSEPQLAADWKTCKRCGAFWLAERSAKRSAIWAR